MSGSRLTDDEMRARFVPMDHHLVSERIMFLQNKIHDCLLKQKKIRMSVRGDLHSTFSSIPAHYEYGWVCLDTTWIHIEEVSVFELEGETDEIGDETGGAR